MVLKFNQNDLLSDNKEIDFTLLKNDLDLAFSDNVHFSYINLDWINCTFENTLTNEQILIANNIFVNHLYSEII